MIYDLRFAICDFIGTTMRLQPFLLLLGEKVGVRAVLHSFQKGAE